MELSSWITIATVCATGASTPGPSLAVVLRNTIRGGRRAGVLTGLGHGLGVGIYAFAAVVGVSTVVAAVPGLSRGIELAGAAYLAWLGAMAWRAARESGAEALKQEESPRETPERAAGSAFRDGFLIAFLNPKIAVFFLALLGSFLPPDAGTHERAGVAALAMGIDAGWYVFAAVVLAGTGAAGWLKQRAQLFDRLLAVLLIAVAVYLALGLAPG